jgi:hypothetical protein
MMMINTVPTMLSATVRRPKPVRAAAAGLGS